MLRSFAYFSATPLFAPMHAFFMITRLADAQWCRGKRCTEFPFHFENTAYAFIVAQYLPELPLWMLVTFPLLDLERTSSALFHTCSLAKNTSLGIHGPKPEVIVRRASAFGLRVFLYPEESAMLITEPRAPSSVLAHFMGFADLDRSGQTFNRLLPNWPSQPNGKKHVRVAQSTGYRTRYRNNQDNAPDRRFIHSVYVLHIVAKGGLTLFILAVYLRNCMPNRYSHIDIPKI